MFADIALAINWNRRLDEPRIRWFKKHHSNTNSHFCRKRRFYSRRLVIFTVALCLAFSQWEASIHPSWGATTSINIQNFAFSPQKVAIQAGDSVTWANSDPVVYTLWFTYASNASTYLLSPPINPRAVWTHTFSDVVNLTYYDFDRLYITGQLNVAPILKADFGPTLSFSPSITFGATVSGGTLPYSFLWTFGDGASSTLSQPTHTYGPAGTYLVTLKVTDSSSPNIFTFSITHSVNWVVGGSVATGTLVTLADGSKIQVERLQLGMEVRSYDMNTHRFVTSTIIKFYSVVVDNYMTIETGNGRNLTTDQNPHQTLYVRFSNGSWTLLPVTQLKVGYYLFDTPGQTWVPITSIQHHNGGQFVMWDIYTTAPGNYIANDILDPLKR